ncbi:MAG TPA: phage tail protein [Metalysinibacillus sp.]
MQKYRTFLTKKGREKIVAAEAAGTHLALRHVAVGDALDPPTEDLTALRNEVWRGEVNRIQVDAKDAHVLNVETVIPAQDGGFMVRELGLFDTEGDLIAVGRAPDSYKPMVEDGAAKSLLIVFKIIIDNTAVVALSVDDSVVLVTREYLAQQLSLHTTNKDNPHGVTKAQVGLNNVANYAVATEAEAKEGTSNTKYMTPLRTNQLVGQIAGETAGGVQTNLNEHIADTENPHNVTKAQVGLSNVDNVKQANKVEFDIHTADKANPHGVTKSQVGLASVLNYGVATQTEAETGTSNAKYMTPLSTKQAITKQAATLVTTHVDDKTNPHNVTKAQVGLAKVLDYELATEADAEAGTSHQKYMTPLRTKQAIEKKISSSVDSTSEVTIASSKAIKTVMDKANEAFTSASNGKEAIKQAITGTDNKVTIPTNPTFEQLADSIKKIKTGKRFAEGEFIPSGSGYHPHTVNGLSFTPSFVAVSNDVYGSSFSSRNRLNTWDGGLHGWMDSTGNNNDRISEGTTYNRKKYGYSDGHFYMGYGYFRVSVHDGYNVHKWIAIE